MTDHDPAPPELIDPAPCDCCGVPSSYRRGSMWHGQALLCKACFIIWCDPPTGVDPTRSSTIAEARLRLYGERDFSKWDVVR